MADYIVGLTGGIGSGKTTVSNFFTELGITVVDADIIARDVVKPGTKVLEQIAQHFGSDVLLANGELNRPLLRQYIFNNEQEKTWLNQLMHPVIRQKILTALKQSTGDYCILSAPLLFENQLNRLTDRNLVVDVSPNTQILRTVQRDDVSDAQVQAILASQMERNQRLTLADDVLNNECANLSQIKQQVIALDKQYRALALARIK